MYFLAHVTQPGLTDSSGKYPTGERIETFVLDSISG